MIEHLIVDKQSDTIRNVMNLALILDALEGMIKQYILREIMIEELEKVQLDVNDFIELNREGGWKYDRVWKITQKLLRKYHLLLRHFTFIGIAPKIKINLDMATEDIKRDRIIRLLEDTLEDSPDGAKWFDEECVRLSRKVIAKSNPANEVVEVDREDTLTELDA